MENFYLLRNNRESGPYTAKDLKAKGLFTTDLLWIDGESTCWKNSGEFAALKDIAKEPEKTPAIVRRMQLPTAEPVNNDKAISTSSKSSYNSQSPANKNETVHQPETTFSLYYDEVKFSFSDNAPRKNSWRQSLNLGANLIGLATLLIGVILTAFVVKMAVDNLDAEPEETTADAKEIVAENLQEGTAQHAAMSRLPAMALPTIDPVVAPKTVKDSVSKTLASVATIKKLPAVKKEAAAKTELAKTVDTVKQNNASPVTSDTDEKRKAIDDATAKAAARAGLQLSANDYKIGFLGGISHLVLTVSNPSNQPLENIAVEVEYLKPNGKVVTTKTVDVGNISAGENKTVAVADNGRGVSIRYHIVGN